MSMSELARSDTYDPNAVDWSRMNQPFGTLTDPNPVQYSTAGGRVQIRPSDIDTAIGVALGASGGGLSVKGAPPRQYLRVGDWHPAETSRNYARGEIEPGVSVYELHPKTGKPIAPGEGEWADIDMADRLRGSEPKYIVQGEHVGIGHDGEPLLKGLKKIEAWTPDWVPKPLPAAPVAPGEILNPSMTRAGAVRKDPALWSPLSEAKLTKPLSEMEHRYSNVRTPEDRIVDPASMVGGHLILTPWDLSAANKTLTHVDNFALPNPVPLHGGQGFPEANRGMAAASERAFATPLNNLAAEYAEKGPVYIAPMTMSPMGVDASHHVADPLAQMVQAAKITRKDAKAFDSMMRESVPDWVSIKSPKFQDYISEMQGGMTTKALMANRMALKAWQDKGFPNVAAVRHAVSEPSLIDAPRNSWGMSLSEYTPGQGLLETSHPSYSKGVAGNWMGRLANLSSYELGMPAAARGLAEVNAANKAAGKKVAIQPAYHAGKPIEGVPRAQYLDQEWLDNLMKQQGN